MSACMQDDGCNIDGVSADPDRSSRVLPRSSDHPQREHADREQVRALRRLGRQVTHRDLLLQRSPCRRQRSTFPTLSFLFKRYQV